MDNLSSPLSVGRGRGLSTVAMSPIPIGRGVCRLPVTSTPMPVPGLERAEGQGIATERCHIESEAEPTILQPGKGEVPIGLLANMAQQIGHSIGEAIASRLESRTMASNADGNATSPGGIDLSDLSCV